MEIYFSKSPVHCFFLVFPSNDDVSPMFSYIPSNGRWIVEDIFRTVDVTSGYKTAETY